MIDVDFSQHTEFLKPERLNKILSKLSDKYAKTRAAAARGLGGVLNPEAVPALSDALQDTDRDVWSAALRSLSEIGSRSAIDTIIEALDDQRGEMRADAARYLGMIRSLRAAEELRRVLKSETDISAKQEMIEALGRIPDEAALHELAAFLTDKHPNIRWSATWAIGMIGRATRSRKAVEMLLLLERHNDRRIQHEAATALRMINPKQI